jgi:hypothetical protein
MRVMIEVLRVVENRIIMVEKRVVIEHEAVKRVFSEVRPNDD